MPGGSTDAHHNAVVGITTQAELIGWRAPEKRSYSGCGPGYLE